MPIKMLAKTFISDGFIDDLKRRCNKIKEQGLEPQLTIYTNDNDDASKVYIKNKLKRCEEIGIKAVAVSIEDLNYTIGIKPIIIQQPCSLSKQELSDILNNYVELDVDGFSSSNLGKIFINEKPWFYPCTPKGIISLLEYYIASFEDFYIQPLEGKYITVVGRSNIVGKPLAAMLENKNATVSLCHSKTTTYNIKKSIEHSDIIISAIGKANFYDEFLDIDLSNKILIDVGINRNIEGKLCGDFSNKQTDNCYAYTPVPGGIGPMTVIMLCENVIEFYEQKLGLR